MVVGIYLGLIKFQAEIFWEMSYLDVINTIFEIWIFFPLCYRFLFCKIT